MDGLSFGILLYFSLSTALILFSVYVRRKLGMRARVSLLGITTLLFLAPVIFLVSNILNIIYPASRDPTDIIYGKLNYYEGKSGTKILEEIRAAGETLGWNERGKMFFFLDLMISQGYARCKMVSASKLLDEPIAKLEKLSAQLPDDLLESQLEGLRKEIETLRTIAKEVETVVGQNIPLIPLYFKGDPPKRKKKREKFFVFGFGGRLLPT